MTLRMPIIPKVPPPQVPMPRTTRPSASPSSVDADAARDPYHGSFDISKIGGGIKFRAGYEDTKKKGLWQALGKIKRRKLKMGRNLSEKNLQIFHGLISERLKERPENLPRLNRFDKREILYKAHQRYYKHGELSKVDMGDLRHIVDVLGEQKGIQRASDLLAQNRSFLQESSSGLHAIQNNQTAGNMSGQDTHVVSEETRLTSRYDSVDSGHVKGQVMDRLWIRLFEIRAWAQ